MTLVKLMNQRQRTTDPWMNNLIDSLFQDSMPQKSINRWSPAMNISENSNAFEIEVATPGVQKSDLKIDLQKDKLVVSYEQGEGVDDRKFSQKGFEVPSFSRSFHLPESVDRDQIEASYTDGVLRISLTKKKENIIEPRQILVR